jgi:type III secretion apparatus needle protein
MSSSSSINMTGMTNPATTAQNQMTSLAQSGNMTNPQDLLEMQAAMYKYQTIMTEESELLSDIKQISSQIIQHT